MADGVELLLHVQPAARRAAVVGQHGDRLKIAVAAPPERGRANGALLQLLADALSLPRAAMQIEAGASGRDKRVRIRSKDLGLVDHVCQVLGGTK